MKHELVNQKTGIAFDMDARTNRLLSEASVKSQRTKRKEALLRLSDHLERFEAISHKGEAVPRPSNHQKGQP